MDNGLKKNELNHNSILTILLLFVTVLLFLFFFLDYPKHFGRTLYQSSIYSESGLLKSLFGKNGWSNANIIAVTAVVAWAGIMFLGLKSLMK